MNRALTKETKRDIRKLAAMAYSKELARELESLNQQFTRWKSGEITPHELSDMIHTFHDGISRELYSRYTYSSVPIEAVAYAIINGTLTENDVPDCAKANVLHLVEFLRSTDREES
jgi:hypothetical protein